MNRLTKINSNGVAYMAIADGLPKRDQELEGSKPILEGFYAMVQKLAEYEDLEMTPDELAELKELQTPKKPSIVGMQNKCPNIDCFESVLRHYDFCSGCGQKIDWNKD